MSQLQDQQLSKQHCNLKFLPYAGDFLPPKKEATQIINLQALANNCCLPHIKQQESTNINAIVITLTNKCLLQFTIIFILINCQLSVLSFPSFPSFPTFFRSSLPSLFLHPLLKLMLPFLPNIYNHFQSIEEMKALSKAARQHKRLVLGSTGKFHPEKTSNDGLNFSTIIRPQSFSNKLRDDISKEKKLKRCSSSKTDEVIDRPPLICGKMTTGMEIRQQPANFRCQVKKREKLVIHTSDSSSPLRAQGKENVQLIQRQLFEPTDLHGFDLNASEMVSHMKDHEVLVGSGESNYILRKEHMAQMFSNMIEWVVRVVNHESPNKSTCSTMNSILSKLSEKIQKYTREKKIGRLSVNSRVISCEIRSALKEEEGRMPSRIQQIVQLVMQEDTLQQSVQKLRRYEQTIKKECKYSQGLVELQKRQLDQLRVQSQKQRQQIKILKETTLRLSQQHKVYQQLDDRVKNFVCTQQSNKIIKEVFQDYKQIEADLFEYAVYLQSNQLASDLYYEPHPFSAIEQQTESQHREVNKNLIQNQEMSVEEKCVLMRDFLMAAMGRFKKKDEEMGKVNEFRVKCIHNYIEKMKKWLNNWEFKQEFLVNLRKEFAYDSEAIIEVLKKLGEGEKEGEVRMVKELISKIIENYRMGNSFY